MGHTPKNTRFRPSGGETGSGRFCPDAKYPGEGWKLQPSSGALSYFPVQGIRPGQVFPFRQPAVTVSAAASTQVMWGLTPSYQ